MSILNSKHLLELYKEHKKTKQIVDFYKETPNGKLTALGMIGSVRGLVGSTLFTQLKRPMLFILPDAESASYFWNDLNNLIGAKQLLFFPSSYKRSVLYDQLDHGNLIMRTEVINKLGAPKGHTYATVTYPEALIEKLISREKLETSTLNLSKGESISIEFINEVLHEYKFERVDFVYQPGQYSIRGSIVDIFSFSNPDPYRIDFFGDDVDSIRTFDINSQLSKETVEDITIVPNIQHEDQKDLVDLSHFISSDTIIYADNLKLATDQINELYQAVEAKYKGGEAENVLQNLTSGTAVSNEFKKFAIIEQNTQPLFGSEKEVMFENAHQPTFNKNFELLVANFKENISNGFRNLFFTDNGNQVQRLQEIFEAVDKSVVFDAMLISQHKGFIDGDLKIACYTDHQIFERYHKHKVKRQFESKESLSLKEINNLSMGDYVVHIDHGIGTFAGLEKVDVNGKKQESIKLIYKNKDVLYVGIHNLHKISKYKGKEGTAPKIHALGSGVWQKTKEKAKGKVKDIAKDLIKLYAERKAQLGFGFSPDTYMQSELEASFFYEDTPDQLTATKKVKKAMEADFPMDMLICGDVGFGKTEVAIRAAFKAVADNKQVAILVPTTILALQHFKTFSLRLKDFPCTVDFVSRLKKTKDVKETLQRAKEGKIDILIGTHRLVSKDVEFKDLGLLIVDEEQKFGVATKDKLKKLKVNVDTLTLTATPIPRTLQFSLMGARDLAVINTPPPNRHPIITEVHTFNDEIIREAIVNEVERNGQVFFINNRVQNIYELEGMVNRICPGIRTVAAHGQMEGPKLEAILLDFINGEYDVLIATTIIETGLDIPNANTIIINDAQNFGLSDLHQLRGRVGRSNKKAHCYLLAPPLHAVSQESRRRLKALEEFTDLGSGFQIAMQDLDIRGAGNLLGGEQSGFITDIGYETYQKILNEAMQELKESEYKDLFAGQADSETPADAVFVTDCSVETDFELMFSQEYISSTTERIKLYRELDNIDNETDLLTFEQQLEDRFGKLPKEGKILLDVVRLRWLSAKLGWERIILKSGKMLCYFIANQESPFYQTPIFANMLQYVQHNAKKCLIREKNNRLQLVFHKVSSMDEALEIATGIGGGSQKD